MAMAPNFGAGIVDNDPKKLPMGVLAADTITTSLFINSKVFLMLPKINHFLVKLIMYAVLNGLYFR
ncbi:hypothetical protein GCM10011364_14460 [Mangrovimonas yunxiaonensis]|nr:hypothetical protein GCM10011364_14460 [Mangrovimonas yunxiaonensis]